MFLCPAKASAPAWHGGTVVWRQRSSGIVGQITGKGDTSDSYYHLSVFKTKILLQNTNTGYKLPRLSVDSGTKCSTKTHDAILKYLFFYSVNGKLMQMFIVSLIHLCV